MECPLSVITVLPAGRKSVHKNLSLLFSKFEKTEKNLIFLHLNRFW